jgi:hypothetical protein
MYLNQVIPKNDFNIPNIVFPALAPFLRATFVVITSTGPNKSATDHFIKHGWALTAMSLMK